MSHSYAQREAADALHFKGTVVSQATNSHYKFTEACLGATLARHDLGIEQVSAGQSNMGQGYTAGKGGVGGRCVCT